MREAMDEVGLTSGQVAYRMGVSDGTVRGWTTGRRGIGPEELVKFAGIIGYPIEYFLYPECQLPEDFSLRGEVRRLTQEVTRLAEKVAEEHGVYIASDEQALEHLREAHNLTDEALDAIRRIIREKTEGEREGD